MVCSLSSTACDVDVHCHAAASGHIGCSKTDLVVSGNRVGVGWILQGRCGSVTEFPEIGIRIIVAFIGERDVQGGCTGKGVC